MCGKGVFWGDKEEVVVVDTPKFTFYNTLGQPIAKSNLVRKRKLSTLAIV